MRKTFEAVLEKMGTVPNRTVVRIPFDPHAVWPQPQPAQDSKGGARPSRGDLRVKGTIRAAGKSTLAREPFPFSNTFLGKRLGSYLMVVTLQMQRGAHVAPGSTVQVEIEPDMEKLNLVVPPELLNQLRQDRAVLKWFDKLPYAVRRWIAGMVRESKSAEVRQRRAERWAEQLMLTMEGELETPPILKAAFRAQPQAEAGWEAMTLYQRRLYLLTIFNSRSPEARARRVQDAVAHALRAAKRKASCTMQDTAGPSSQLASRKAGAEGAAGFSPRKKRKPTRPSHPESL
jgi:uncharacterized protein YdeI (YjbR/CyaY-like superfamily)